MDYNFSLKFSAPFEIVFRKLQGQARHALRTLQIFFFLNLAAIYSYSILPLDAPALMKISLPFCLSHARSNVRRRSRHCKLFSYLNSFHPKSGKYFRLHLGNNCDLNAFFSLNLKLKFFKF